jgi:hypothetical protein
MKQLILIALVCFSLVGAQQVYGFIRGNIDFAESVDSFILYLTNDEITTLEESSSAGFLYIVSMENGHYEKPGIAVDAVSQTQFTYVLNRVPPGTYKVNIRLGVSSIKGGSSMEVEVNPFSTVTSNIVVWT